jgi:hypothetical protein
MHYISPTSAAQPFIVDADGRTQLVESMGRPYAGCYVMAVMQIWAQDNSWGRKINAELLAVQFMRAGSAFAGGARVTVDDFEDLSVDRSDVIFETGESSDADSLA